jgi:hypothetical protein
LKPLIEPLNWALFLHLNRGSSHLHDGNRTRGAACRRRRRAQLSALIEPLNWALFLHLNRGSSHLHDGNRTRGAACRRRRRAQLSALRFSGAHQRSAHGRRRRLSRVARPRRGRLRAPRPHPPSPTLSQARDPLGVHGVCTRALGSSPTPSHTPSQRHGAPTPSTC